MLVEQVDLRQLALEISENFDALSVACYMFEEEVKQRFNKTECESCKATYSDLLGAMAIIKPTLHALAKTFQFFNFDQAAIAALTINHLENQLHNPTEQQQELEQN